MKVLTAILACYLAIAIQPLSTFAAEEVRFTHISVTSGVMIFVVVGPPNVVIQLETSTDLETWRPVGLPGTVEECNSNNGGFLPVPEGSDAFFIRAVIQ